MSSTPADSSAIRSRFQPCPTDERQRAAIERIRARFTEAALAIAEASPSSREQAIALTELESASHWAVRAIAANGVQESAPRRYVVDDVHVELIARAAHEANLAYCLTVGDYSQAPWGRAPEWQRESVRAGVRAIAEGRVTKPEDSHASWARQKFAEGWTWGAEKDPVLKRHPCLVAFELLPETQQRKDVIFLGVVRAMLEALA